MGSPLRGAKHRQIAAGDLVRPEPPFFLFVLTFPFPDMMLESSGYAGEIDSPIHVLAASRC